MTTFLPRLLERLNAPIVSSRLDSDDLAYLSKFESEISDSDNLSNNNSEDTISLGNYGNKFQTYLSSLNSHIVDQDANYSSYPVKYTNKIIRNESGLSYRRTTSSISGPLVDYIQKSLNESQESMEMDNPNSSIENINAKTAYYEPNNQKKQSTPTPKSNVNNSQRNNNSHKNPRNENVVWEPGFTRQLGTKGRRVLLDLIRKVYRSDPDHYKRLLEMKNPPTSISNLPFCNIITLWELANDFGVFDQAMLIHYAHTKPGYTTNFSSSSNSSKVRKTAPKPKKVKYYDYDNEPNDDQYEEEYISSFSNSKTSRGRKIVQPKRYDDYDQAAQANYKFPTDDENQAYHYDYNYNNHRSENSPYYYKNNNRDYLSLNELNGHKIERLTSPLIF